MTDEEIMQGLENACNSATGTFGWTVPPYPILRDYILKLQAENAALRERLEKAVELPCKVGDTIYLIVTDCFKCRHLETEPHKKYLYYRCALTRVLMFTDLYNYPVDCINGEYKIIESKFELEKAFYTVFCFSNHIADYNKTWFTDRAAAEKRLAELGGEKNND